MKIEYTILMKMSKKNPLERENLARLRGKLEDRIHDSPPSPLAGARGVPFYELLSKFPLLRQREGVRG
jgi:hypothetical protein